MKSIAFCCFIALISRGQEIKNITKLDNWTDLSIDVNSSEARYNDCWGYTQNGIEYAMIGSTIGTHYFKITKEGKFELVDFVQGRYSSAMVVHRDIKTYKNYAYAVCDEGNSSLQIIDLSYLPDSVHVVTDIQNPFGRTHNLFIDSAKALMYACSVHPIIASVEQPHIAMRVFSLADPENPVLLWDGPSDIQHVHDAYVRDNIAILNLGHEGMRVYDFSNPSSPILLSKLENYTESGYNHQGWLSPNGKTYILGDETEGKRLKKMSFENNTTLKVTSLFGTNYQNNSVPHNIMCTDEFAFVAYYNEGLRIFDIRPTQPIEIAAYDTYLKDTKFKMNGMWGVYSLFPSGRILASDRQNGLFLFDFDRELFKTRASEKFMIYPNPILTESSFTIRAPGDEISQFTYKISDATGKEMENGTIQNFTYEVKTGNYSSGVYFIQISYKNYLDEDKLDVLKLVIN